LPPLLPGHGTLANYRQLFSQQNIGRYLTNSLWLAAMTTLLVPAEAEVRRLLGIPDNVALAAHIGVGYRAEDWPQRLTRRPVEEFAFLERFGEPLG